MNWQSEMDNRYFAGYDEKHNFSDEYDEDSVDEYRDYIYAKSIGKE